MAEKNNNRIVLLSVIGVPVTMILASTWLWYFVVKGDLDLIGTLGTANQGTLLQPPRQIDEFKLYDESGQPLAYASLEPRWSMVVPGRGARCGENCEQSLYVTRQIRVAMGKYFNQLRRLYVSESGATETQLAVQTLSDGEAPPDTFADYLAREHSRLETLTLSPSAYNALFAEHGVDESTWYLVDPAGWVMMSYNGEDSYKDVISDLKFLIKNSGG